MCVCMHTCACVCMHSHLSNCSEHWLICVDNYILWTLKFKLATRIPSPPQKKKRFVQSNTNTNITFWNSMLSTVERSNLATLSLVRQYRLRFVYIEFFGWQLQYHLLSWATVSLPPSLHASFGGHDEGGGVSRAISPNTWTSHSFAAARKFVKC